MASCDQTIRVSAYADGEMSPADRNAFETHLNSCVFCTGELEQVRSLSRAIADRHTPALSPQALKRIHKAVAADQFRKVNRFAAALSGIAAMLAIAAIIGPTPARIEQTFVRASWENAAIAPNIARTEDPATTEQVATAQWVLADLSAGAASYGD